MQGHRDDSRSTGCGYAAVAHRPSPRRPAKRRTTYRRQVPSLVPTAGFRVSARPSASWDGRSQEGRLLVPCPWIVEPWTHQPQHPVADSQDWLRHQVVVAEVTRTPRATSQPRPATSTTENTTHRSFPPTKQPSPAKSPNAVDEDA
jgi:hypothetical protein